MENRTNRRDSFKTMLTGFLGLFGFTSLLAMERGGEGDPASKTLGGDVVYDQDIPLFSSSVRHGNTLYVSGKGAQFEGDIKVHTEYVLKQLEEELLKNGSSMQQVLKVNVYLADMADFQAMNEVYRGKFGGTPPVRTTVAVYGGVPGISLVEMDCIAAIGNSKKG